MVQLRERDLDGRALAELARALLAVTRPRAAPLLINDRVDVALAVGADGVHLPSTGFTVDDARGLLGSECLLGVSCHSAAEARAATAADFVVLGPVWATRGKDRPIGTASLGGEGQRVYAIGGIDGAERAGLARAAGAYGVAGIRAFREPEPLRAMFDILHP
jgi:thiamine-phosphate pyrophosphorylase